MILKNILIPLSAAVVIFNHGSLSANEADDRCEVYAPTINEARAEYAQSCSAARVDCDPINGQWVCSSHQIINGNVSVTIPTVDETTTEEETETTTETDQSAQQDTDTDTESSNDTCEVTADTQAEAFSLYGSSCTLPRVDCDPIGGGQWMCASYNNPKPVEEEDSVTDTSTDSDSTNEEETTTDSDTNTDTDTNTSTESETSTETETNTTTEEDTTSDADASDESCEAVGNSLVEAIQNYAKACSLPRKDCDPTSVKGQYICGSYINPTLESGSHTETSTNTDTSTDSDTSTDTTDTATDTDTSTDTSNTSDQILEVEAESASLTGSWGLRNARSGYTGSGYIQWTGSNSFGTPGLGTMSYTFNITSPGTYQLQLRSRSINGADVTVNNDSWVRIVNGPSPYNSWVKAYQSVGDNWTYQTVAEISHADRRFIRFYASTGKLTVQVSGRSNGHAIDSIRLLPVSLSSKSLQINKTSLPANTLFEAGDLLALHFDNAAEFSNAQTTVADLMLVNHFDIRESTLVVSGAFSDGKEDTDTSGSESVFQSTWGEEGDDSTWLNANDRLANAHNRSVERWTKTLQAGNHVWVSEIGGSDFTINVLQNIANDSPSIDLKNVFVIQQENVFAADSLDREYLESVANVVTIPSGTFSDNGSANLSQGNDDVANRLLVDPEYGTAWSAAFEYVNPFTEKFDASDAVELMFIMGLEENHIKDWPEFRDYLLVD